MHFRTGCRIFTTKLFIRLRYDIVIFILAREYTQSTGAGLHIINVIVISL